MDKEALILPSDHVTGRPPRTPYPFEVMSQKLDEPQYLTSTYEVFPDCTADTTKKGTKAAGDRPDINTDVQQWHVSAMPLPVTFGDSPAHVKQGGSGSDYEPAGDGAWVTVPRAHAAPTTDSETNSSRGSKGNGTWASQSHSSRQAQNSHESGLKRTMGLQRESAKKLKLEPVSPAGDTVSDRHGWVPGAGTPVSPDRHFSRIVGQRSSADGRLYKVVWRDSWVHESRLPELGPVRQAHIDRYGKAWEETTTQTVSDSLMHIIQELEMVRIKLA